MVRNKTRRNILQFALGGALTLAADGFLSQSSHKYSPFAAEKNHNTSILNNPEHDDDIDPNLNTIPKKNEIILPQLGPYTSNQPLSINYMNASPYNFGHLFLPDPLPQKVPVLVMIHGGGWRMPTALNYCDSLSEDLVSTGIAVWNIEYRRVGGGGGWPTTMVDVAHAVDFLPTLKSKFPALNLNSVYIAGHSSGGQLAAWAASRNDMYSMIPGVPFPNPAIHIAGLITLAGVFDLKRAQMHGNDRYLKDFFGGDPSTLNNAFRYSISSPINQLPLSGTRILAFHGDLDNVVNIDQSIIYVKKARASGLDARLIELPGRGHSAMVTHNSPTWDFVRKDIASFIIGAKLN